MPTPEHNSNSDDDEFFWEAEEAAEPIGAAEQEDYDFSDLELDDPFHFQQFDYKNEQLDVIRLGNGNIYEGESDVKNNKHGKGTLYDETRKQQVQGLWSGNHLIELEMARLKIAPNKYISIYMHNNLIISDEHKFIADITIADINLTCDHFLMIKRNLFEAITIQSIYGDALTSKLNPARQKFQQFLEERVNAAISDAVALQDMFVLFRLTKEKTLLFDESEINLFLLENLKASAVISAVLKSRVDQLLELESTYWNRNKNLPKMRVKIFSWSVAFNNYVHGLIEQLKEELIKVVPSRVFIPSSAADINKLLDYQVFMLRVSDVQLYADIEFTVRQHTYVTEQIKSEFHDFFAGFVADLWAGMMKSLKKKSARDDYTVIQLTEPVFLQLFKTFLENLVKVTETEETLSKILSKDAHAVLALKSNKNRDVAAEMHRLTFLIRAMDHFKPGHLQNRVFKYNFVAFQIEEDASFLKKMFKKIKEFVMPSLSGIKDSYLIWLYYIHDYFTYLVKHYAIETENKDMLIFINSLLTLFQSILKNGQPSFERLRILAENILKFVESLCAYFKENPLENETEIELLMKQSKYLSEFDEKLENYSELIANIIETYKLYWEQRILLKNDLLQMYHIEPLRTVVTELIQRTTVFLHSVFDLRIYTEKTVIFLRSFNEFLIYFRATKFPWYVKQLKSSHIKLANESKQSYLVTDIGEFLKEHPETRHYTFSIVAEMITCARQFLQENRWRNDDKMQAASDLILAMGRSFINHSEQPNYQDYDNFLKACTEPFYRVSQNSATIDDFRKRIEILENFYVYTKELTVMNIGNALNLCREYSRGICQSLDYVFDTEILSKIYGVYEQKFQYYIEKHISDRLSVRSIIAEIKTQVKPKSIDDWDEAYKTGDLPELLAGLSAVWSIETSRDVIGQNSIIKPHCIQILCILRLLGAGQDSSGFDSHLAQVLTGQGKSIVIALLSTILALTMNNVRVVCYNEYLAQRDETAFKPYFKQFDINNITYGTFNDMANELLSIRLNNRTYTLRQCVADLVTGTLDTSKATTNNNESKYSRTILIIDEVDVFFTPQYYGAEYRPIETIHSVNITKLQLKIWNLVKRGLDEGNIKEQIRHYMEELSRAGDDITFSNIYTRCRSYLNKSIDEMIGDAIVVNKATEQDWHINRYTLDKSGQLVYIKDDGEHSTKTYCRYYNIFNYYRLKKLDGTTFVNDYPGYLNVKCGNISYAILPKEYRRILGVTGTLTTLSTNEIKAVNSYNITRGSNMPSFFGRSKLAFNQVANFAIHSTEEEWKKAILQSVMKQVADERAVLVFFDTEKRIDEVKENFKRHVAMISVLTGNEADASEKERCIDRAGVAKNVTLATRRMGRGVDFKSNDSNVERKGGVHVIQTFLSTDIKEEIQIKGRTARKDNKGSYELILCRPYLNADGYKDAHNYTDLNSMRATKSETNETELALKIEKSRTKHEATMELQKQLMFNYDPNFRNQYFTKYPFIDLEE